MQRLTIISILVAVCCSGSYAVHEEEAKWVLAKDTQGVKVYTRKVDGIDLKAFKGVTTMKTSLTSLVALVKDTNAAPDWLGNCSKSEVLNEMSTTEIYTYALSKAPWPVKDRDSITHNLIFQDKATLAVTIKQTGKPKYIKEKENITRVKRLEGFWQFTPKTDGYVEIVYQNLSDPGGAIPVWLINSSIVSQPFETLLKMREVVLREKYQEARLEFIENPQPERR